MNQLDLAWETFDFHTEEIARLEALYISSMKKAKIFSKKRIKPSNAESNRLYKSALSCCEKLIVNYLKQLNAIIELQKIYDSDIEIPMEYEMDGKFLVELAEITNELIQDLKLHKSNIIDDFFE